MNNIILQVCHQFIIEVMKYFKEGKAVSLATMEKGLKESSDKFLQKVIKAYLEETDRQIAADKAGRRQKGLVIERRNEERTVYTRFGALTYYRSYYFDKRKRSYIYPVDLVAGLEPYERVSPTVAADMVGHAAEASYGESSRHVTGGEVSRQTVMKKIRKLHGLKEAVPPEKRAIKALHVDADEDHVALQDGSNTIVPIVTVHEGVQKLSKNRNKCVNAHHICAYGDSPEDLWLKVAEWIYDAYDVDGLDVIYIHGDGAQWIKKGLEVLPKSKPVLDKYHLNKAIMNSTGAQQERRTEIRQALSDADLAKFKKIIKDMIGNSKSDNELKRIKEFRQYVINNWAGIKVYKTENCGGSSAEAHVSHVLSARMSSRPMGWSREGVKYMAELRAFCANGGAVGAEHLVSKEKTLGLVGKAMKRAQKRFQGITQETLGNLAAIKLGKITPISKVLRSIQNGGLVTR